MGTKQNHRFIFYLFIFFWIYITGICSFHLSFHVPPFFLDFISSVWAFQGHQNRDEIVTVPQGRVIILSVNYNNMSNWATQLSAILLPKPFRNCSIELWVETHVCVLNLLWVCVRKCVGGWLAVKWGILAVLECSVARSVCLLCSR